MIAVDAAVLVELLADGPRADAVESCLRRRLGSGKVVVCDAALAQVCASLRNGADALAALEDMGIHYSATEAKSAVVMSLPMHPYMEDATARDTAAAVKAAL